VSQATSATALPVLRSRVAPAILDVFGRPLRSLRVSVTDRCNLRCQYCMPEEEYIWLKREDILSFEEIGELIEVLTDLGVEKVRLTGGEPLLRRDLARLVRLLTGNQRVRDLALTTNGILLAAHARSLREAGLERVTVSLDTLRPERFRLLVRRDLHAQILEGIAEARRAAFNQLKVNAVVIRGFNDDELADLVEFGRAFDAEVRFIEYMDVGGATRWSAGQVVTGAEILDRLGRRFGGVHPLPAKQGPAPAARYALPDGTTFGIIASVTQPFCGTCDRARLTPDGVCLLCLYSSQGVDLKSLLRSGTPREEIAARIAAIWRGRNDRGAEERQALASRGVLFKIEDLRKDPHREMHTRGG
jgi:GTP 3',8-cyclase